MKAIIGLGNPGIRYEKTRHNVGFQVVDEIAKRTKTKVTQKRFLSKIGEFIYLGEKILLVKPQTYMNASGDAVHELCSFYKDTLSIKDLVLVYDDVDLPFGEIRTKNKGSAGGQKGMASVVDVLDTQEISRVRIGIRTENDIYDLSRFVLGKFSFFEKKRLKRILPIAASACMDWLEHGSDYVMTHYNSKIVS